MRVVAECVMMNNSRCLELEVKVSRSLVHVTGNGLTPSSKTEAKISIHKFACTNVTPKKENNKRLQVAYTHAHAYMWPPVPQGSC